MKTPDRRLALLCVFFGIWSLLCAALLIRSTVLRRDELRKKSEKISWRTGVIPVLRGRILDRSGLPLAWTEAEKDAVLESLPVSRRAREALFRELREAVGYEPENDPPELPRILARNLTPEQMTVWLNIAERYPSCLFIRTRILRKRVEYPNVRTILGECAVEKNGVQKGMSGLEKEYEERLAGQPGRFRVMLDRNGRWLEESLRIEDGGKPGEDVTLDALLRDMTEKEGRHEP